jgi:hypothetical protein
VIVPTCNAAGHCWLLNVLAIIAQLRARQSTAHFNTSVATPAVLLLAAAWGSAVHTRNTQLQLSFRGRRSGIASQFLSPSAADVSVGKATDCGREARLRGIGSQWHTCCDITYRYLSTSAPLWSVMVLWQRHCMDISGDGERLECARSLYSSHYMERVVACLDCRRHIVDQRVTRPSSIAEMHLLCSEHQLHVNVWISRLVHERRSVLGKSNTSGPWQEQSQQEGQTASRAQSTQDSVPALQRDYCHSLDLHYYQY